MKIWIAKGIIKEILVDKMKNHMMHQEQLIMIQIIKTYSLKNQYMQTNKMAQMKIQSIYLLMRMTMRISKAIYVVIAGKMVNP